MSLWNFKSNAIKPFNMFSANLIAYAFVRKGIEMRMPVTQMKLQKMVYFAHGYHLYKFDKPLILEEFEAWEFGPVVRAIYSDYKVYGRTVITWENKKYEEMLVTLDENAREAIEYTWQVTSKLSAATLSTWTHQKGSPWDRVYSEHSLSNPIDNYLIKQYFTDLFSKVNQKNQLANAIGTIS